MKNENSTRARDRDVALNVRCLHKDVRQKFKIWCAKRELPMERVVAELIEQIVTGKLTPEL